MAVQDLRQRRGSSRSGAVFGALSLMVMAALIPALHPPQPPVPPTAAYAPEAAQNPLDAPNNQSADNGKGGNAGGANGNPGGHPTPTPAPSAPANGNNSPTTTVPRDLDCVTTPGYPPRQVEDTQSPPCVPAYTGPPATSTAPGVTGSTITVAYFGDPGGGEMGLYQDWINNRFEFYGRKVKLVNMGGCSATGQSNMDSAFLNDATRVQQAGAFASLTYCDEAGQEQEFYDDLARMGIISIANRYDIRTEADYAHPNRSNAADYEWGYFPSFDENLYNIASLVCDQLAGKPAPAYTLSPGQPRKFGVIYSTLGDSTVGSHYNGGQDLADQINQLCPAANISGNDVRGIQYQTGQQSSGYTNFSPQNAAEGQQAAQQFKLDGVTTVVTIAHSEDTLVTMLGADNIKGYFPEWVLTPDFYNTIYPLENYPPQDQWAHAFGLDYMNRMEPAQNSTWYWPLVEEDPTYTANPYIPERYYGIIFAYYQFLILASGIQMAGPDLTPQTFAQGLWTTHFPNPPSPINEGRVGFDNNSHTFVKDLTLYWYSASSQGAWGGQAAANCYVNGGIRYRAFTVPSNAADPPLTTQANSYGADYFSGTCDP
ncbi:MAG: hypothetical protein ACYDAC_06395 [Candidatus Dormibacteria bacterium]